MSEHRAVRTSTDVTSGALEAATAALGGSWPVQMVNLLSFRAHAEYASGDNAAASGQEAYLNRYVPAFGQVAAALNIKTSIVWLGGARAAVVAPEGERWDAVAIVEYPDFAAFRRIVESPEYARDADPHRKAALADWRLIATLPMTGGRSDRRRNPARVAYYLGRPAAIWMGAAGTPGYRG